MFNRNYKEKAIESVLFSVSALTVVILFLICLFLFRDSLLLFKDTSLLDFLTGKFWYPTSVNKQFGLLPLFFGSLIVTAGAILFAVPLGIASAIYISEIAHPKVADFLKPFIEILAGIPSVVFGFFGLVVLVPIVQNSFQPAYGTNCSYRFYYARNYGTSHDYHHFRRCHKFGSQHSQAGFACSWGYKMADYIQGHSSCSSFRNFSGRNAWHGKGYRGDNDSYDGNWKYCSNSFFSRGHFWIL